MTVKIRKLGGILDIGEDQLVFVGVGFQVFFPAGKDGGLFNFNDLLTAVGRNIAELEILQFRAELSNRCTDIFLQPRDFGAEQEIGSDLFLIAVNIVLGLFAQVYFVEHYAGDHLGRGHPHGNLTQTGVQDPFVRAVQLIPV